MGYAKYKYRAHNCHTSQIEEMLYGKGTPGCCNATRSCNPSARMVPVACLYSNVDRRIVEFVGELCGGIA